MNIICNICNTQLSNWQRVRQHLIKHQKNGDTNKDYQTLKMECLIFNHPEVNTKDKFVELYENNSIPDFKRKFGITDARELCNFYGVKTKSISERKQEGGLSSIKYKETCLKRYGAENALSKGTVPFIKRNKTVKDRYGVNNVFQLQTVIDRIQSDELCIERHGCTRSEFISQCIKKVWENKSDDEKQEWLDKSVHSVKFRHHGELSMSGLNASSLEKKVCQLLLDGNVDFTIQHKLQVRKQKYYYYDILINELNLLIEVNGDYWHANPEVYKVDDEIHYFGESVLASVIWERNILKEDTASQHGFIEIAIWEKELKSINTYNDLRNLIQNKLILVKMYGSTYFKERDILQQQEV